MNPESPEEKTGNSKEEDFWQLRVPKPSVIVKRMKEIGSELRTGDRCPKCGKTVSPDYKICPYCGTRIEKLSCLGCGKALSPEFKICPYCGRPVTAQKPTTRTCEGCGAELQSDFKFCRNCGRPSDATIKPSPMPAARKAEPTKEEAQTVAPKRLTPGKSQARQPLVVTSRICKGCGKGIPPDSTNFCPSCGAQLSEGVHDRTPSRSAGQGAQMWSVSLRTEKGKIAEADLYDVSSQGYDVEDEYFERLALTIREHRKNGHYQIAEGIERVVAPTGRSDFSPGSVSFLSTTFSKKADAARFREKHYVFLFATLKKGSRLCASNDAGIPRSDIYEILDLVVKDPGQVGDLVFIA